MATSRSPDTRRQICYVVPHLHRDDASHLAHVPRLLDEIGKRADLWVIVERGEAPDVAARRVYVQSQASRGRIRRYRELFRMVREVRAAGCRRVFVRISQGAAFVLIFSRRRLDIEVFYWNSGATYPAWPRMREAPLARTRLAVGDLVTRYNVRRADRLVTGPRSMVDYYVGRYGVEPGHCVVLNNDVDVKRFRPASPGDRSAARDRFGLGPEEFILAFVGRISRYKGGGVLPALVRELDRSELAGRYRLLIVGAPHLQDAERDLDGHANVALLGELPNHQVPGVYAATDVFILPSLAEGFPRVILEAMASGLPVVAHDVGGVRELLAVGASSQVVSVGDLRAFVDRLVELHRDPQERAAIGARNRDLATRYTPEATAAMFIDSVVDADLKSV